MLQIRDEDTQVSWACSAQAPDLLPDKYKNKPQGTKGAAKTIKAVFE